MPWVVNECERRGARGAACGFLARFGWFTGVSLKRGGAANALVILVLTGQLPAPMASARGVVGGPSVCLGSLFPRARSGLMLFNSYAFIFLFLPIVLAGYFWLG